MNVVYADERNTAIAFRTLKSGDCFRMRRGEDVYLKAFDINSQHKAVHLKSGRIYELEDDKGVIPLDVEAVVQFDC